MKKNNSGLVFSSSYLWLREKEWLTIGVLYERLLSCMRAVLSATATGVLKD